MDPTAHNYHGINSSNDDHMNGNPAFAHAMASKGHMSSFAKTSQAGKPIPYLNFAHGTYSNDSIMGGHDFYNQNNIFGFGNPLTSSNGGFMNPFGNNGYNSPKQSELGFNQDRFKHPFKSEMRKDQLSGMGGFTGSLNNTSNTLNQQVARQVSSGLGTYGGDQSRQFLHPESKLISPLNSPNQLSVNNEGPRRYNQLDARSADYSNYNFGTRPEPPAYKKSNSVDENMIGNPIYSYNSAFSHKNNNSQNDNSHSGNISSFGVQEEENKFSKMLKSDAIDLDDFPVPPVPKEFKNSTKLLIPVKMEEMIKKLTLEAEELVFNNEYEQAKRLYLKVARMNPYDGVIWRSLGHIYLLQGKLMESFNCFQGCLYHSEEQLDPAFWFAMSRVYDSLELYEYCITTLKSILEMSPTEVLKFKVHCKLGMVCCKVYKLDEATENFQKALSNDQKNQEQNIGILIKLGLIEEERGDLTKAINNYESALKIDPNSRKVYAHIAWCYYKSKNNEMCREAISMLDNTTPYHPDPDSCISTYIKARIHQENRNLLEAQRLLCKCLDIDNQNAAFWCSLGVVNFDAGNREKAFEFMRKAHEINDQLPEVLHNYAILLELNCQEAEAVKYYQALLRISKYEEFIKKRMMWIQGGMINPKNSLRNNIIYLKHPEDIIPNTLKIYKLSKKTTMNDINANFKVVNKRNGDHGKGTSKVRFMNVPSLTSEDKNNEDRKQPTITIKPPLDREVPVIHVDALVKEETTPKQETVKSSGSSILDMIRRSEKEKISDDKPTNMLGQAAKWKSFGKSKLFARKKSASDPPVVKEEEPMVNFKDALDNASKFNNDSEVSFGQGAVKVPDLCNALSAYQSEVATNKLSTDEVIEFKTLTEKLFKLCNKPKKDIPVAVIDKSHLMNKIGTPSFKVAKPCLYNASAVAEVDMFNQGEENHSGVFSKNDIMQGFSHKNLESDKGSILNDVANPKDFQSCSLDIELEK